MNLAASYDAVADEYVRRIYDELRHKPLDRALLARLAQAAGGGLICDLGCGPGQVARFLHGQGARVTGIDLSEAMVERARQLNPGITFEQGDLLALNVPDGSFAAVAAFYSLIHIPRERMAAALRESHRVLRPGGLLLAAFHLGTDMVHLDEWWGQPVSVDFHFFQAGEFREWLERAGFRVEEVVKRGPYPEVEHTSHRAYVFARRETAA